MAQKYNKLIVNTVGIESGKKGYENKSKLGRIKKIVIQFFKKTPSVKKVNLSELEKKDRYDVDELVVNNTNEYLHEWMINHGPDAYIELFKGKPIKDILELVGNPIRLVFKDVDGAELSCYGGGTFRAIDAALPAGYKETESSFKHVIYSK